MPPFSKCVPVLINSYYLGKKRIHLGYAGLDSVMYWVSSSLFRTFIVSVAFVILQEEDIVCSVFKTYLDTDDFVVFVFYLTMFAVFPKLI